MTTVFYVAVCPQSAVGQDIERSATSTHKDYEINNYTGRGTYKI